VRPVAYYIIYIVEKVQFPFLSPVSHALLDVIEKDRDDYRKKLKIRGRKRIYRLTVAK